MAALPTHQGSSTTQFLHTCVFCARQFTTKFTTQLVYFAEALNPPSKFENAATAFYYTELLSRTTEKLACRPNSSKT
jgi:hypothetical protein